MTTPGVYALLAAASYSDVRIGRYNPDNGIDTDNDSPLPEGWTELTAFRTDGSGDGASSLLSNGFSARVYRNASSGEVVISYGGTRGEFSVGMVADFLAGSIPLAFGNAAPQAGMAAELYQRVKAQHSGDNISFTGHSLGGGLASLMAVYFDRPAYVFAPAPFQASADSTQQGLQQRIFGALATTRRYVSQRLGSVDAALADFDPSRDFATRERNVTAWSIKGEVIEANLGMFSWIEGATHPLFTSPAIALSAFDRHLVDLHAAGLLVPEFQDRAAQVPSSLRLMLASDLFGGSVLGNEQVFITDLLRNHVGIRADDGAVLRAGNSMLTHFSGDLGKLGANLSDLSQAAQEALVAQMIEWYRFQPDNYSGQEFLSATGNVLQYTSATGAGLIGGVGRSQRYVGRWTTPMYNDAGFFGGSVFEQWNVVTGATGGAVVAMDPTKTQVFVGGDGSDHLLGGAKDDDLWGGSGADTIDGGGADDRLNGGAGADIYRFADNWGHDTIDDSDGDGRIEVDGVVLPQGFRVIGQENVWASQGGSFRYVLAPAVAGGSNGTLYILGNRGANTITIRNYNLGQLGITLSDTPAAFAPPDAQQVAPAGSVPYELVGDASGTATRDELVGSGGIDLLRGELGDDSLDGGDDGDILIGGLGADRIVGGAGNDAIHGGGHTPGVMRVSERPPSDVNFVWLSEGPGWYAGLTTEGTLSVGGALFGYTAAVGGANDADVGDLISAGDGNDWVYGDAGADVIDLGTGDDIAYSGQGADIVFGGPGADRITGDYINFSAYLYLVSEHGADVLLGDGGDDIIEGDGDDDLIYGGADNDVLWGDDTYGLPVSYHGNDLLDGGSGNDRLTGQGGDDELYGGTGDDLLVGDDTAARLAGGFHGADHLDGEDGNDELQGQGGADALLGGSGADTLFGDDLTSRLAGAFHGDDYLDGEDGDDYLEGQGGADMLFGGSGADTMYGDAVDGNVDAAFHGDDYLDGEAGADLLIGGSGNDVLRGGADNDRLQGDDLQSRLPVAAHGSDTLDGEDGDDVLAGQGGADVLYGGDGNDVLMGDAIESEVAAAAHGDDHLDGGAGNDTLIGGGADDVLSGGEGDDALNGDDSVDNLQPAAHGNDTLFGDGGNDLLVGAGGDDVLDGGSGDDVLRGDGGGVADSDHGDDVLLGGAGVDLLQGEGGADVLYGGTGDDALWGDGSINAVVGDAAGGDDLLDGGDGDDGLVGGAGNDQMLGGAGNDVLYGDGYAGVNGTLAVDARFEGDDVLEGGEGDDSLEAGGGSDLLIGGPGADVLKGGAGVDRYLFAVGDSGRGGLADRIDDGEGANVIAFAAEVSVDSLDFATSGFGPGQWLTDRFTFGPNREEIVVGNLFVGAAFDFHLADGQRILLQRLIGTRYAGTVNVALATPGVSVSGGSAGDRLEVSGGDSTVAGGGGDDTVILRGGNNRYLVSRGDGRDRLTSEGTPARPDTIVLMDAIGASELALVRDGNDLKLSIGAGLHEVRVVDYYLGGVTIQVELDGALLGTSEIAAVTGVVPPATRQIDIGEFGRSVFLTGGDDVAVGKGGDDTIWAGAGNDVVDGGPGDDFIHGEAGDDVLRGGRGWDRLLGGPGADVYEFSPGDGPDTVFLEASPPAGQKDRILMRGASPSAVQVFRLPGSLYGSSIDYLVLARSDGSNEVRIAYFFDPTYRAGLAEVEFDDGTSWTAAQLETLAVSIIGAENQLQGTSANDVHLLDHPNDRVVEAENGGEDTVRTSWSYSADPNVERVELTGILASNVGGNELSNVLVGNAAANRLNGGRGDDLLVGGGGDDVYTVNYNEGTDTIVEAADGGIDTLVVGWEGRLPENVENLVAGSFTYGPAYAYGRYLTGNALDNRIDGSNYGGFRVIVDGGSGVDLMIGGGWQSVFYVDNEGDRVVVAGGYNTVYSTVSYTMADGVRELYLSGEAQFGIGNAADNILSGWSIDKGRPITLRGGEGNDRYIVGAGDAAIEGLNAGSDTVVFGYQATLFSASDHANIENLELANEAGAAGLLGNSADNRLTGNGADNVIDGGAGNDVLVDWAGLSASGYRDTWLPSYPYGDQDLLLGGGGDDELRSLVGSDVLDGGAGNDRIVLGDYSNFPQIDFGAGGGNDVVEAYAIAANQPTWVQAKFGAGLTSERVRFSLVDGDLRVGFDGSSDTLSFRQYAPASGASFGGRPLTLRFADGVEVTRAQIQLALADTDGAACGPGDDFVQGTAQEDDLAGLGGSDLMLGGAGSDLLHGGEEADLIHGGEGDDELDGGAGDDILDGGDGDDLFIGGAGDDVFRDGAGASTYRFGAGFGRDSIEDRRDPAQSPVVDVIVFEQSISAQGVEVTQGGLSELLIRIRGTSDQIMVAAFDWNAGSAAGTLEEIRFFDGTVWDHAELVRRASRITGTEGADVLSAGGSGDARMYGLGGNDSLTGGAGNDLLDGGAGSDTMSGGPGDDTYVVDASGDAVTEGANEGSDHVLSSVTQTLAANVERLTLTGAAAINGTGNALANALVGNGAGNVLNGGSGADTMSGGAGNDTYVVDNAGDVVVENAGEGTDLVQSSVSTALAENVENLTLTGTGSISGTGNALDNLLTGNSGANTLVGGAGNDTLDGGAGSDTMRGGTGDDTYVVGSTGDVVAENANEGLDTVRSPVTYTLAANVENLTLTGTSAISGTGNGLDNVLIGNSANNTLTGGAGNDVLDGGSGSDTMRGGTGDDTYVVNASKDVVTEYGNEGTDTVQSSLSLTLASNVEHLILTGSSAINGTGNALANHLRGNGAANTLNGAGGNDVLQGAGGNDTVTDTGGNNLLDGGDGADSLNGGTGREFVAGGVGSDTLKLGGGADIIAFNRGNGSDSVTAPTAGAGLGESNDTVSLGGVRYADLRLARSGADLYLKVAGTTDSLKFTGWYSASGNRTVTTLQLVVDSTADYDANSVDPLVNRRVVRLNFVALVDAFNSAYGANPAVGDWAIPGATLSSAFVAGSDTQALGGALAYCYGRDGNFGALDFAAAGSVLGDANFAGSAQTFSASPAAGQARLLEAEPIVDVSTDLVARIASVSQPGDAVATDSGGTTMTEPAGTMRSARRRQELAEVWAGGPLQPTGTVAAQYLTIESWMLAADTAIDAEASGRASSGAAAGADDEQVALVGAPVRDLVELAAAATVAGRWVAVDEAIARLDPRRTPLLGGEAVDARPGFDDLLGVNAIAMANASRPRHLRSPAAAY